MAKVDRQVEITADQTRVASQKASEDNVVSEKPPIRGHFEKKTLNQSQSSPSSSTRCFGNIFKRISRKKRKNTNSWIVIEIEPPPQPDVAANSQPSSSCEPSVTSSSDGVQTQSQLSQPKASRSQSETLLQQKAYPNVSTRHREVATESVSTSEICNEVARNDAHNQLRRDSHEAASRGRAPVIALSMDVHEEDGGRVTSHYMKPPKSLQLRDKIVLHSSLGPQMESIDSIGSCSLNVNSAANGIASRSDRPPSSDMSVKSIALSSGDEILDGTRANGHVPSYVGISCAISGYSSYSRYCASTRTSLSRGSSPTVKLTTSKDLLGSITPGSQPVTTTPVSRLEVIASVPGAEPSSLCQGPVTEDSLPDGEASAKSLVQRRIESLYGSAAGVGWRESRAKVKTPISGNETDKVRSPSCPPPRLAAAVAAEEDNSIPNPPVFRHIDKAFREQIERDEMVIEVKSPIGPVKPTKVVREPVPPPKKLVEQPKIKSNPVEVPKTVDIPIEEPKQVEKPKAVEKPDESKLITKPVESKIADEVPVEVQKEVSPPELRDGHWFLSQHDRACEGIKFRVIETDGYMLQDGDKMSEDVAGIVRSAIGKANLLMAQKLSQFKDLCLKNINQSLQDGFETKIEDLEGFWAMVSLQVDDIHQTFDDVNLLKKNNWEMRSQDPLPKVQPKIRSPRKQSTNTPKGSPARGSTSSSATDSESISAKEALRRNRLREAKRKQAAKLGQGSAAEQDSQDVTIFVAPNNPAEAPVSNSQATFNLLD